MYPKKGNILPKTNTQNIYKTIQKICKNYVKFILNKNVQRYAQKYEEI